MPHNLIRKKGENTWYVKMAVPPDVQHVLGKKVFLRSLKTAFHKEAMDARLPYLASWKAAVTEARAQEAFRKENWRPELAEWGSDLDADMVSHFMDVTRQNFSKSSGLSPEENQTFQDDNFANMSAAANQLEDAGVVGFVDFINQSLAKMPSSKLERVQHVSQVNREIMLKVIAADYGLTHSEVAEAQVIALDPTVHKPKSPITQARLKSYREHRESRAGAPKHVDQQVGKMERLSDFLKQQERPLNFNTVDEWLKSLDRAPATLGQYLMAGTSFWKWAMKYDPAWIAEYKDRVNPFIGHDLPQGGGSDTAGKDREIYTKDDALKLHQSALNRGDTALADLITFGWYTGARIEELCNLTKDSVIIADGIRCFDFPRSKSPASKRVLPIHPNLLSRVDRLIHDTTDNFLIPTESADKYGKRSHAISKAFGRLRTAAGFSKLHVFHGFRHTVVTQLVRADVPDALAKELVGHETGSVTHDVYSKGASTTQKFAAISKLPSLKIQS